MSKLFKVEGLQRSLRDIDRFGKKTNRSVKQNMSEVARLVCSKLMRNTQPWGTTSKAREMGENAVRSDINTVMVGAQEGTIDLVMSQSGKGVVLADGTAIDWDDYTRFSSEIDRIYNSNRRKGRIQRRYQNTYIPGIIWHEPDRTVVPKWSLQHFISDKQQEVGLAKSVWYNASLYLKDAKRMRAPAWIRRHKGAGDAKVRVTPMGITILLRDKLGYLRDSRVLNPAHIHSAVRAAIAGKIKQLKKEIEYNGRKSNR